MALNPTKLLDVRLYQAFDLDPSGRVLAGSDDSGSTQLVEILADGTSTPLTALPGACSGRYLPGERAVIVSHDDGGNERHQLSLLRLPLPSGQPAGWPTWNRWCVTPTSCTCSPTCGQGRSATS